MILMKIEQQVHHDKQRSPPWEVQLDEGVHMEVMLDYLFQLPCDLTVENQPQFMTLGPRM
jgi:hypothetical protein